mmetsp:Transcript_45611/g.83518  ORF Transcript_45611/g.83518 Transcript_45611/m.83518 type:complete len:235 (-) Transcript_45611:77-781(-)
MPGCAEIAPLPKASDPNDRECVLEAVKRDGRCLVSASDALKDDKEIVLEAVQQYGVLLRHAGDRCQQDKEIVIAAVNQTICALMSVADWCLRDPDIVRAAVKSQPDALVLFPHGCRRDRQLMQAAVEQRWEALSCVSDCLIDDASFATEARRQFHILRVSMLSGKHAFALYRGAQTDSVKARHVLQKCCERLELDKRDTAKLVHGSEMIPPGTSLADFPGLQPLGEVSDYQLVV